MSLASVCREEAVLLQFLDETLEPEPRVQVQHHVDICPPCRRRLEGLRATLNLAAEASTPAQNPLFASGFSYQVRQGIEKRRRRKGRARLAAGIAAVCGCLLGAVWLAETPSRGPESGVPLLEEVAFEPSDENDSSEDAGEELASLIDSYLLETASTDELMGQMEVIDSTELVAMFEED